MVAPGLAVGSMAHFGHDMCESRDVFLSFYGGIRIRKFLTVKVH